MTFKPEGPGDWDAETDVGSNTSRKRSSRIVWPGFLAAALLVAILFVGVLAGLGAERLWFRPHRMWERAHHAGFYGRGGMINDRRRMLRQRLTEQLHLNPAQAHQIDSIMMSQDAAFSALQQATRSRFEALILATHQKIDSVLTPDQRALHDSLMRHRPGPGSGPRGFGMGRVSAQSGSPPPSPEGLSENPPLNGSPDEH